MERFIMTYRLYLRMRMRRAMVEKQIQWTLLYVQKRSADIWKENLFKDLELRKVKFKSVGEFLLEL